MSERLKRRIEQQHPCRTAMERRHEHVPDNLAVVPEDDV